MFNRLRLNFEKLSKPGICTSTSLWVLPMKFSSKYLAYMDSALAFGPKSVLNLLGSGASGEVLMGAGG